MTIKIGTKVIKSFSEDYMMMEILEKWGLFDSIGRRERQSLFEFALMLCGDDKPSHFVTPSQVLHDNKENIYKNTDVKIVTLEEVIELVEEDDDFSLFKTNVKSPEERSN